MHSSSFLKSSQKSDLSILSPSERLLVSLRLWVLAYFLIGGELAPTLSTERAALLPTYAYKVWKPIIVQRSKRRNRKQISELRIADLVDLVAIVLLLCIRGREFLVV